MSAIIVSLLVTILLIALCIFFLLAKVSLMQHAPDANHAKCIANMAHYTGNHFAAQVLLAAAEDYTSAEGQHEVEVILHKTTGLEPIPALWMRERATRLQQEIQS